MHVVSGGEDSKNRRLLERGAAPSLRDPAAHENLMHSTSLDLALTDLTAGIRGAASTVVALQPNPSSCASG